MLELGGCNINMSCHMHVAAILGLSSLYHLYLYETKPSEVYLAKAFWMV